MKYQLKILSGVLGLAMVGQVSAATNWTLTGTPTTGVSVSAYANTNGTSTTNNAALQTIEAATWVASYGGITNADNPNSGRSDIDLNEGSSTLPYPEHAIDNNQRYDMALLTFTDSVKLTQLSLGYTYNDSDVTVMAYTGAGAPTLIGKTFDALVGWTLIGNYSNVGSGTSINSSGIFSSYWLIGAYNPLAANGSGVAGRTTSMVGGAAGDSTYDYVKLSSVTGCISGTTGCNPPSTGSKVPEPGSLALLGVGVVGLMRMRKSRQARD